MREILDSPLAKSLRSRSERAPDAIRDDESSVQHQEEASVRRIPEDAVDDVSTQPDESDATEGNTSTVYVRDASDSEGIIKNHVIAAMGLGLVPLPVFDVAAIVGVQLNMVRKLGQAHEVPFRENAVRGAILSLIGGIAPVGLGMMVSSFIKSVPGLGSVTGAAGVVVLAGALTYAVGSVFERHLSSGGTFLDFDASKARSLFRRKFEEGKSVAKDIKAEQQEEPTVEDTDRRVAESTES